MHLSIGDKTWVEDKHTPTNGRGGKDGIDHRTMQSNKIYPLTKMTTKRLFIPVRNPRHRSEIHPRTATEDCPDDQKQKLTLSIGKNRIFLYHALCQKHNASSFYGCTVW
jgi:hypothetical protein